MKEAKVVGRKAMNGVMESIDDEEIFKQVMSQRQRNSVLTSEQ